VILEAIDLFGLAGVAENADAGERCQSWALHQPWLREPLASNSLARLREPWLPSPTRWVPWAQGVAGSKVETPLREGERELDVLPPESERERCAPLQRNPNEGEHEPIWLPGGAL